MFGSTPMARKRGSTEARKHGSTEARKHGSTEARKHYDPAPSDFLEAFAGQVWSRCSLSARRTMPSTPAEPVRGSPLHVDLPTRGTAAFFFIRREAKCDSVRLVSLMTITL